MVSQVTAKVHIFWLVLTLVAFAAVGESAERNRVRLDKMPACSISLNTSTEAIDGRHAGEQWRIVVKPVIVAEFAIGRVLVAGISLPGSIEMGHTYHGTFDFMSEVGVPSFELAFAGGSGKAMYRFGLHSSPPTGGDFAIGGTALFAIIRDPVALKYSGRIEIAGGQYDRGLRPVAGGCSLSLMTVLNEVVAVDLGISVDLYSRIGTLAFPPALFGSTGIYLSRGDFTFSVSSRLNLWSSLNPATIIMSVGWSTI